MGSKRPFSAVESAASEPHGGDRAGGFKKKRKMVKAPKVKEESINWVKKRARQLERLLAKAVDKLPADKRREFERELASHQKKIRNNEHHKERNEMIKKYHMVRFFERQKAERLQKQLRKRLESATDLKEIDDIKTDIHIAEVDHHYTVYFPYMEKYVSIYPVVTKEEKSSGDKAAIAARALHAPRPPLWSTIEKAMEEGKTALEQLRDRRPDVEEPSAGGDVAPKKTKHTHSEAAAEKIPARKEAAFGSKRQARTGRHPAPHEESESESDGGGFFE